MVAAMAVFTLGCHRVPAASSPGAMPFDAHVQLRIDSLSQLLSLTDSHDGKLQTVKFIIADFGEVDGETMFMDGSFYQYHDEWYWFSRLNGHPALGQKGVRAKGCATPRVCSKWAKELDELPMNLQFVDDRLYSQTFYDMALSEHRKVGVGALLYRAAEGDSPEIVGFRLEYVDVPSMSDISFFFTRLQKSLPTQMARHLVWLPRSPAQIALGNEMVHSGKLTTAQIMQFEDLALQGEAEIYNPGVTVGRLMLVEPGTSALSVANDDYILVVSTPPDDLPQTAGLISAVPLTALSHLNILAKKRGIPSGYVGGIFDDPWIRQLSDGYAPVVLQMQNGEVKITPLSSKVYQRFSASKRTIQFSASADYGSAPYVIGLSTLAKGDRDDWPALVGGKAAGFQILYEAVPDRIPTPVAMVTTRGYVEHIAPLYAEIDTLLFHPVFQNSAKVRYYVLEGEQKFFAAFTSVADRKLIAELGKISPLHASVGHEGGLKAKIERLDIPAKTLSRITRTLRTHFQTLPETQGLRFRSSSTVEDIDGFNGAGLYESSTGFMNASKLPLESDRKHTIEWALKKTWASYWNYQAFEERRSEGMDHLSGAMGIVVHPRFDDAAELANGVITFTWNFAGDLPVETAREYVRVNVQEGALSVTNPDATIDALPETVEMLTVAAKEMSMTRLRPSIINGVRREVLTDAEYSRLFALCRRIASAWRVQKNVATANYGRSQTITLDLEFKKMSTAWQGFSPGTQAPALVIKQVRALEPAPLIANIFELNLQVPPMPKDALLRASRVDRVVCANSEHQLKFVRLTESGGSETEAVQFFAGDISVTAGNRLEVLSPIEYYPLLNNSCLRFTPTGKSRMGTDQMCLTEMACESTTVAASNTLSLRDLARKGRVIGRCK